jgi:lysophospholipase L1-like esterase
VFVLPFLQAALPATATAAAPDFGRGWTGTWSASVTPPPPAGLVDPGNPVVAGFANQTVREIVHTSVGGSALRLHLSNRFGTTPLTIGEVTVGIQQTDAGLTGTPLRVTFHGHQETVIPKGGQAVTDPIRMNLPAASNLSISVYLPDATGPTTSHGLANQINWWSGPGNFADRPGGQDYPNSGGSWFFLSAVDVRPAAHTGSVAVLGDDVTDGFGADFNQNDRWTDYLATRLANAGSPTGVLNEGVAGNRLLNDSPCFGEKALTRVRPDVLGLTGVRTVVLDEGMNDIGASAAQGNACFSPNPAVTAQQIIRGYEHLVVLLRVHGLRVIGTTITPDSGSPFFTTANEQTRQAVNAWIRTSHWFDGVIDADGAVRDPAAPQQLLAAYDRGDHLHLNGAGYQALANAIDLRLLRTR